MARFPGGSLFARLTARARSLWRGLMRRGEVEAEMDEELRHHVELRTEDLIRQGLSHSEARRRAHREFGHVEAHLEKARAARGLRFFDRIAFSWLDVKLGLRMLVKHPGLTAVAVLALGIGIPVGLAPSFVVDAMEAPLPVPDGERVVHLRYWSPPRTDAVQAGWYDYDHWVDGLTSFEALGAARVRGFTLDSETGPPAGAPGAEVTASTFDLLKVPPLLGRTLLASDEVPGAPDVVVLGYDVWQIRLAADPDVVGRTLRLGSVPYTVVGVMPKGFLFPLRNQLWIPLRRPATAGPGEGGTLTVYGRLASEATSRTAEAELTAVSRALAMEYPEDYAELRPEVVPFAYAFFGVSRGGLKAELGYWAAQLGALALLVVAAINVALLVFARTATRSRELAVRTALGAGRRRIVTQVFVESLVLALVASGVGLLVLNDLPRRVLNLLGIQSLPWWIDPGVSGSVALKALGLAAVSAVVAGVIPALRVTGRAVQRNIQRAEAGNSGIRFGRLSSALIVLDVAVAVAAVGVGASLYGAIMKSVHAEKTVGIPAEEYLAARILVVPDPGVNAPGTPAAEAFRARVAATQQALVERLEAEPGVRAVAMATELPRMSHRNMWAEVDDAPLAEGNRGTMMRIARVDPGYFDALDHEILAGRGFDAGDLGEDRSAVIVDTTFVRQVLGGRQPLGRQVRYRAWNDVEPGPWYQIVGVVGSLGMHVLSNTGNGGLYHPLAPGEANPVWLGLHVGGDPTSYAPRVRTLVSEIDPTAMVVSASALDKVYEGDWYIMVSVVLGGVLLVVILLALAASGIYAIMSFSVAERTREIGVRTALGAQRRDIALTVLRRAFFQLGLGVLVGLPLAWRAFFELNKEAGSQLATLTGGGLALVLGVSVMLGVGLLACAAPTVRALRIEPTDALREGG